jgi:hypothetical protein
VFLAPLAQQKAQYLFGRETKASAIAYFEPGTDVRADDGLLFTAGFKNGQHFRVLGEAPSAQFALAGGPAMLAMAVELTPEAFA